MKAVVWPGIGDIRLDTVPDPGIKEPTDAVIRITRSATCGTDPHFVRGTMSPMTEGTILGHEAVSVVETVGDDVRGFLPVTGSWSARRSAAGTARTAGVGYYAQCDVANPNGADAGTCFFGSGRAVRHRLGPAPGGGTGAGRGRH